MVAKSWPETFARVENGFGFLGFALSRSFLVSSSPMTPFRMLRATSSPPEGLTPSTSFSEISWKTVACTSLGITPMLRISEAIASMDFSEKCFIIEIDLSRGMLVKNIASFLAVLIFSAMTSDSLSVRPVSNILRQIACCLIV